MAASAMRPSQQLLAAEKLTIPTAKGALPEKRLANIPEVFDPLLAPSKNASNLVDGVYTPATCLQFVPKAVDPVAFNAPIPLFVTMKNI